MEVAIGNSTPFQREVREWQRIDPNTGALVSGRLEADRWINGPLNAYGKVVDSQNVSTPNGIQHSQRKQLEVLKARTSSGSLQVVRAQTVQKCSSRILTSSTQSSSMTSHSNFMHSSTSPFSINNSSSNHNKLMQYQTSQISNTSNNLNNTASSLHNKNNNSNNSNNIKSLFQQDFKSQQHHHNHQQKNQIEQQNIRNYQNEKTESQLRTEHLLLPTEISTKFSVGVNKKTQLDLNERENFTSNNSHSNLIRGKSVSNEDLTAERDENNFDDDVEPVEWRRVSKIRRSLQYPKTTSPRSSFSRPPDLPENSVSVLKIKQELENGRRLNTAMRNNHVDLVALDSILNGVVGNDQKPTDLNKPKKATFLTAESLKEIRGKLRRLSDESLYKEDMSQKDETSPTGSVHEDQSIQSNYNTVKIDDIPNMNRENSIEINTTNTNSISRMKLKNLSSNTDWFSRRKSYGFENMTQQNESNTNRMLESTDSGIGRSDEISSNWSPTESQKSTIVSLGNNSSSTCITLMNGSHDIKQNKFTTFRQSISSNGNGEEIKRHSIAVDEAKYVRDNLRRVFESKTTSIHLNGMYSDDSSQTNNSEDRDGRKSKRVEFCKTEVHFAAESGRVNIVETDGKPPPTNNFRRRRRGNVNSNISSSYLEAINSGIPVTHFGDNEKLNTNLSEITPLNNQTNGHSTELFSKSDITTANNLNISSSILTSSSSSSSTTTTTTTTSTKLFSSFSSVKKESEEDNIDENGLRGILKNKPIKPKPYHLGENIENSESLWGIRLRPVSNDFTNWRNSANLEENETEINSSIKSNNEIDSINQITETSSSTSINSGYSTKVNLSTTSSNFSWNNKETSTTAPSTSTSLSSLSSVLQTKPISKLLFDNKNDKTTKISIDVNDSPNQLLETQKTQNESLKSTSLIMRTIRSASQFDEAIKKLHITEEKSPIKQLNSNEISTKLSNSSSSALKLISQMNAITKSNSANSIFKDTTKLSMIMNNNLRSGNSGRKYSSSLDGDYMLSSNRDTDSDIENMEKLNYRKSSLNKIDDFKTSYYTTLNTNNKRLNYSSDVEPNAIRKPVAAPRMKKLGPTNLLSHQLTQLRRLYEAADQDSDDSAKADEEVKHYLGNSYPIEEKATELSGSWSRVKAKRTVQKQNIKDDEISKKSFSIKKEKKPLEYKYKTDKSDVLHSNVMQIALHSPPSASLKGVSTTNIQKSISTPIAKPRLVVPTKASLTTTTSISSASPMQSPKSTKRSLSQNIITITPQTKSNESTPRLGRKLNSNESDSARSSLKLSTGPRKLREHELSYFGINLSKSNPSSLQSTPTNTLTRSSSNKQVTNTKINGISKDYHSWQLTNDKPDLLKHSPHDYQIDKISTKQTTTTTTTTTNTKSHESTTKNSKEKLKNDLNKNYNNDEPIYENIKKSSSYSRKDDLERDKRILNELSKTASEILTSVSGLTDDDSMDEVKKSLIQKSRLHTIEENKSTQKKMQSKAVQVSRSFGDSLTRNHRSSRVSSASSNESIPRSSSSPQKLSVPYTTRRLCSKIQHEQHHHQQQQLLLQQQQQIQQSRRQVSEKRSPSISSSTKSSTRKRLSGSKRMERTSSRDTLNSTNASSSEDLPNVTETPRRHRRIRTKEKSESQTSSSLNSRNENNLHHQRSSSLRTSSEKSSSKKTHSHHRSDSKHKSESSRGIVNVEQQPKIRMKSGVVTTTSSSSSSRRQSSRHPDHVWK